MLFCQTPSSSTPDNRQFKGEINHAPPQPKTQSHKCRCCCFLNTSVQLYLPGKCWLPTEPQPFRMHWLHVPPIPASTREVQRNSTSWAMVSQISRTQSLLVAKGGIRRRSYSFSFSFSMLSQRHWHRTRRLGDPAGTSSRNKQTGTCGNIPPLPARSVSRTTSTANIPLGSPKEEAGCTSPAIAAC